MSETKSSKAVFTRWLPWAGLVIPGGLICLTLIRNRGVKPVPATPPPQAATVAAAANPAPRATNRPVGQPSNQQSSANFPWFQAHPFAAALTNGDYKWTAEDGKDPEVIRRLAHNEPESQRMLRENDTIYRRQLVYDTKGFMRQAQAGLPAGQSLQQVTVPGLDGQVFQVAVTRTELQAGGGQGQIYGQLPGQPYSMVAVAFIADREAFTVISPQDQIYLQAEAREPGEIVVKSINPGTYGMVK